MRLFRVSALFRTVFHHLAHTLRRRSSFGGASCPRTLLRVLACENFPSGYSAQFLPSSKHKLYTWCFSFSIIAHLPGTPGGLGLCIQSDAIHFLTPITDSYGQHVGNFLGIVRLPLGTVDTHLDMSTFKMENGGKLADLLTTLHFILVQG